MVQLRKDILTNNCIFHIYTRSIAKFIVFNDAEEFDRMYKLIDLYRYANFNYKFSHFNELSPINQQNVIDDLKADGDLLVEILSFCLMPTHIHLVLKQILQGGISKYMSNILNGYSRYFNTKHGRIGPLWSGRFKNVLVLKDEQLLHLTRYIHLNPTSAGLVKNPDDWNYSSYHEYIEEAESSLCNFKDFINVNPKSYRKFVNDQKSYQRDLSVIKSQMIDNYAG